VTALRGRNSRSARPFEPPMPTFSLPARLAVSTAAAALSLAAPAQADTTIATVDRATPVAATDGVLAWSAYDAATETYRLVIRRPGQAPAPAPVAPRAVPFDASLGVGPSGATVAVYSRCLKEPQINGGAVGQLPAWNTGRGCDVYLYDLATQQEQRLDAVSSEASETLPAIAGSSLAFARSVPDARRGSRSTVYVRSLGSSRPSRRVDPGVRGVPSKDFSTGPTSLAYDGTTVVSAWRYVGRGATSEIRAARLGARPEIVDARTSGEAFQQLISPVGSRTSLLWADAGDDGFHFRRADLIHHRRRSAPIPATLQTPISVARAGSGLYLAVLPGPEVEGSYARPTRIVFTRPRFGR
jgi:hypothetical protein